MAQELVRVRVDNAEVTVSRGHAEAKGLEVIDEPATDPTGKALPQTRVGGRAAKKKTSVDKAAAAKQEAAVSESAPDKKEIKE